MMRFELGIEEIDPKRARNSAVTIAGAYVVVGLIPLLPYILLKDAAVALLLSAGMTLAALFVFGFFKGHFTGAPPLRSALQTSLIGGMAAAAAFAIARAIS
jgi:VIT1/CCC1 family predicted Fe2+/Mn2+ transporter